MVKISDKIKDGHANVRGELNRQRNMRIAAIASGIVCGLLIVIGLTQW